MKPALALRAGLFVVLIPVAVAGSVPLRILRARGQVRVPPISVSSAVGFGCILLGSGVVLTCVWAFLTEGHGTLAPIDPPRHLVVGGLYRFTRNPMYNGVLIVLLGEAWLFRSLPVLCYAVGLFVLVHLFVVYFEERSLESRFGESFRAYRSEVPRWGFTLKATRVGRPPVR
jgi:protein-S-isoprenylcysteine O-methyltransferase Ste14